MMTLSRDRPGLMWFASLVAVSLALVAQFLVRGSDPCLSGTGASMLLLAGVFMFGPFHLLARHGGAQDGKTHMQARIVAGRDLRAITCHPPYPGYMVLTCGLTLLSPHWVIVLLAIVRATFF